MLFEQFRKVTNVSLYSLLSYSSPFIFSASFYILHPQIWRENKLYENGKRSRDWPVILQKSLSSILSVSLTAFNCFKLLSLNMSRLGKLDEN